VPSGASSRLVAMTVEHALARNEPGHVACPVCHRPLPVGEADAGERVRCPRCSATLLVEGPKPGSMALAVVGQPARSWASEIPAGGPPAEQAGPGHPPAAGAGTAPGRSTHEPPGAGPTRKSGVRRWLTYGLVGLVLVTCGLLLPREFIASFV